MIHKALNYRCIQLVICIVLDETPSDVLLKITLNHVSEDRCNKSYSLFGTDNLKNGIRADSMICAGSIRDGEDTCQVRRFSSKLTQRLTNVVVIFQAEGVDFVVFFKLIFLNHFQICWIFSIFFLHFYVRTKVFLRFCLFHCIIIIPMHIQLKSMGPIFAWI